MVQAIAALGLRKEYRSTGRTWWGRRARPASDVAPVLAVDDVSFSIERGERVAFIGPNGAGKSTTIKILSGILSRSGGDVTVLGLDPIRDRAQLTQRIAAVFGQRSQLWYHLPVKESWDVLGRIYDTPRATHKARIDDLVARFDAGALANRPVKTLSLGERMRCELIACLLHRPEVLFLDEPTIGLDVEAKGRMRDLVKRMATEDGCTLLLTSHDTGDMESVCDRVIIINQGRIVFDDGVTALRKKYVQERIVSVTTQDEGVDWRGVGLELVESQPYTARFRLELARDDLKTAIQRVLGAVSVSDIAIEDPPMDETIKRIYAATGRAAAGRS